MKEEFKTTIYADTIEGKLGLGVDYYKGETGKSGADEVYIGAEPPTDPQVKLWVDTEAQSVGAVDWNDVGNKPNFATVATSGSYNDLTDKPVIPEAPDLTPYAKTADLSTVATSGSYNDLTDKPVIPEAPDLTPYATQSWVEGKGYTTMIEVEAKGYLTEHQDLSTYALKSEIPSLTGYAKTADLSTVATSGSYEDLTNKPNLFDGDYNNLTNKPNLFSGNYEDLTNKPTIPEAPDLTEYAKKTEIPSLADYSTTAQVQEMISSAIGQIVDGNEVSY